MDEYTKSCLKTEPELKKRITALRKKFQARYGHESDLIVRSPGRAEIIGNHTDYNQGFALSCCISRSIIALFSKRKDHTIRIFSQGFSQTPLEFLTTTAIAADLRNPWVNYAKGVVQKLKEDYGDKILSGADILLDSNIPIGSGVSSSAAYELAIAYGLMFLNKIKAEKIKIALLCQKAENDFVGSPCGFLDQGTITFGKQNHLVFLDFLPKGDKPVSQVKTIPIDLDQMDVEFVIAVDKVAKHDLGASGYPVRRKMCEDSLIFWREKLKRKVKSLREVTKIEFQKFKSELERYHPVMRKRVEHVINENDRVLAAVKALKDQRVEKFGELLTKSGESALILYELDEKTPELTFLYNFGKSLPGVLGIRNMGGGFSATILALVRKGESTKFMDKVTREYKKKFNRELLMIKFNITPGVGYI